MNFTLKTIQIVTGILFGLLGIAGIAGGAGYYFFITQMSTSPPKPIFAEERESTKVATKPAASKNSKKPTPQATPAVVKPEVAKDPLKATKLAPSAYDAQIVWKDGVSLKSAPNGSAGKIGGAALNEKVAIVKESDDKQWALIQPEKTDIQGWVKIGNIDKYREKLDREDQAKEQKEKTERDSKSKPGAKDSKKANNSDAPDEQSMDTLDDRPVEKPDSKTKPNPPQPKN
jgi:hypothetical protein